MSSNKDFESLKPQPQNSTISNFPRLQKPQKIRPKTGYEYTTYSSRQKMLTLNKPVKPYKRFVDTKIADQGLDPSLAFRKLIKTDVVRPIERENNEYKENSVDIKQRPQTSRWCLGNTKTTPNIESIPKFQQFKPYYFNKTRTEADIKNYQKFTLKTDHIAIKIPEIKQQDLGFLKTKAEFNTQTQSNSFWKPYYKNETLNNLSSKNYNIINFAPLEKNAANLTGMIYYQNMNNKYKGVSEYTDLTRLNRPNYNKEFAKLYNENPKRFCKYNGIFSNMYDASHKNGNIITPFGHK